MSIESSTDWAIGFACIHTICQGAQTLSSQSIAQQSLFTVVFGTGIVDARKPVRRKHAVNFGPTSSLPILSETSGKNERFVMLAGAT